MIEDIRLNDYLERMSTHENSTLHEIRRKTHLQMLSSRMVSGPYQALFLKFLIQMIQPERVLEIGSYTGYSIVAMAQAASKNCILETIEYNVELIPRINENIKKAGLKDKVIVHHDKAIHFLERTKEKYDFIFIDADKDMYLEYFIKSIQLLSERGVIAIDNTLWNGKVLDSQMDKQTENIHTFNMFLKERTDVEVILLPIRDGLTLVKKIV